MLVTREQHQGRRAATLPPGRQQVRHPLVRGAGDRDGGTVEPGHDQPDDRVPEPGPRVTQEDRRLLVVRGIGEPARGHLAGIDPCDQQMAAVGTPPEAVVAVLLLGRGEIGGAVAHLGVVVGQLDDDLAVQRDHPQRAVVHVGDVGPGRVDVRVHALAAGRHRAGVTALQVAYEEPAGERERRQPAGGVGRVGHDAAGRLAGPFPAPQLRGGNHLGLAVEQDARIGQQAFLAGAQVARPQSGIGVVGGQRPQENQTAGAWVRQQRQVTGPAEGEPSAGRIARQDLVARWLFHVVRTLRSGSGSGPGSKTGG